MPEQPAIRHKSGQQHTLLLCIVMLSHQSFNARLALHDECSKQGGRAHTIYLLITVAGVLRLMSSLQRDVHMIL
jgi:hypothetical protein